MSTVAVIAQPGACRRGHRVGNQRLTLGTRDLSLDGRVIGSTAGVHEVRMSAARSPIECEHLDPVRTWPGSLQVLIGDQSPKAGACTVARAARSAQQGRRALQRPIAEFGLASRSKPTDFALTA